MELLRCLEWVVCGPDVTKPAMSSGIESIDGNSKHWCQPGELADGPHPFSVCQLTPDERDAVNLKLALSTMAHMLLLPVLFLLQC